LAKSREFGGLGFTDARSMNKCLLSQWIFKLERGDVDLCCTLLRKKYLRGEGFFSGNARGASQFWKGLHESKGICQHGLKYVVGKWDKTKFWHDVWLGECPLRIRFHKLFSICQQQKWEVARVLRDGEINLSFRRNFEEEILEWGEPERELGEVQLNTEEHTMRWALTKHGQFTTAYLYRHCSFSGVFDIRMDDLWQSKLPLKIKKFVWLVFRNIVQTVDNLRRKQWNGSKECQWCNEDESVNHMVFICPLARYVWAIVRDGMRWDGWNFIPIISVKNWSEDFLLERGDKRNRMLMFLFGAICWTLWLNRNDLIFKNKIISSPKALIYKLLSFLQH
jgi:hypothetical protein